MPLNFLSFLDYAQVSILTKEWNGKHNWTSPSFRIYTSHCNEAKTVNEIKNCTLLDYDFGEDLSKKYNINTTMTSTESECSQKCDQDEICTFSSWKKSENNCQLLKGLKDTGDGSGNIHWKQSNPPYFCQKNGTTVTEKEVLCKSVNQVIDESNGKHPFKDPFERSWTKCFLVLFFCLTHFLGDSAEILQIWGGFFWKILETTNSF